MQENSLIVQELEVLVEGRQAALESVRRRIRAIKDARQEPTEEDKKNLGAAERALRTAEQALQVARNQQSA